MTRTKVNLMLFITIFVMAVCPLVGALYFVDRALTTSLDLGFNERVTRALESSAEHLRMLGRLDPDHREQYRAEFERVEDLKGIYSSADLIKQSVRHSLLIYFGLGVLMAVALSTVVAALLSRRIANSYRAAFDEITKGQERVRHLEALSSWQELAKMLAHEIKNPLTPIEMMITALPKMHRDSSREIFQEQLKRTEGMVMEEVAHLKGLVQRFGEFARLPEVKLEERDVSDLLDEQVAALSPIVAPARIDWKRPASNVSVPAKIDSTLFRQVLANILRNGIEANPARSISFFVRADLNSDFVTVAIENDGASVPVEIRARMFEPYVSSKTQKENMGLGLAIVRKIILGHGGDVEYVESAGRPRFLIRIPRVR